MFDFDLQVAVCDISNGLLQLTLSDVAPWADLTCPTDMNRCVSITSEHSGKREHRRRTHNVRDDYERNHAGLHGMMCARA